MGTTHLVKLCDCFFCACDVTVLIRSFHRQAYKHLPQHSKLPLQQLPLQQVAPVMTCHTHYFQCLLLSFKTLQFSNSSFIFIQTTSLSSNNPNPEWLQPQRVDKIWRNKEIKTTWQSTQTQLLGLLSTVIVSRCSSHIVLFLKTNLRKQIGQRQFEKTD